MALTPVILLVAVISNLCKDILVWRRMTNAYQNPGTNTLLGSSDWLGALEGLWGFVFRKEGDDERLLVILGERSFGVRNSHPVAPTRVLDGGIFTEVF